MEPSPPPAPERRNNQTPSSSMPNATTYLMGNHRMAAAISYLTQQIQIIQDELNELDTVGGVSTVCQELIPTIDSVPDALLPETRGPAEVGWDKWFQGAQSSRTRRRWI